MNPQVALAFCNFQWIHGSTRNGVWLYKASFLLYPNHLFDAFDFDFDVAPSAQRHKLNGVQETSNKYIDVHTWTCHLMRGGCKSTEITLSQLQAWFVSYAVTGTREAIIPESPKVKTKQLCEGPNPTNTVFSSETWDWSLSFLNMDWGPLRNGFVVQQTNHKTDEHWSHQPLKGNEHHQHQMHHTPINEEHCPSFLVWKISALNPWIGPLLLYNVVINEVSPKGKTNHHGNKTYRQSQSSTNLWENTTQLTTIG